MRWWVLRCEAAVGQTIQRLSNFSGTAIQPIDSAKLSTFNMRSSVVQTGRRHHWWPRQNSWLKEVMDYVDVAFLLKRIVVEPSVLSEPGVVNSE